MVLGRIVHYTVDAVFLATVVAGVRRSSGFTLVTYTSVHAWLSFSTSWSYRTASELNEHLTARTPPSYRTPPSALLLSDFSELEIPFST